jgi:hypothetical protein
MIGAIKKTRCPMGTGSTVVHDVARGYTRGECLVMMVKWQDSSCHFTRQKGIRSRLLRTGNGRSEQGGNELGTMRECTAQSFAKEYKICAKTAKRHSDALLKNGKATAIEKTFCMMSNEKKFEARTTVTTYRMEEIPQASIFKREGVSPRPSKPR